MHPYLKHSRWPAAIPIAHRGYSAKYPENTMSAFDAAVQLGFAYLETDVHATKDGQVAVFHDDTLERMTGMNGRVEDLTLAELRRLRVSQSEPIPLLVELLDAFPHTRINIDPKQDSVVAPLLQLLQDINVWDRVCVASFSAARLEFMRREAGDRLCTSTTPSEVTRLWLSRFGLPTGPRKADCVQVPPRRRHFTVVDRLFIRAAKARSLPIHVWTINDTREMGRLLDLGVDGIMSDEAENAMTLFRDRVWAE